MADVTARPCRTHLLLSVCLCSQIEVNECSIRNLHIVNAGKFNFDYEWEVRERAVGNQKMVAVTPHTGNVSTGQSAICKLAFRPTRQTVLRGCELRLRVVHGPTYVIQVTGVGVLPGLHFSFTQFNFGSCFLHRGGMPPPTTVLKLTNTDKKDIRYTETRRKPMHSMAFMLRYSFHPVLSACTSRTTSCTTTSTLK